MKTKSSRKRSTSFRWSCCPCVAARTRKRIAEVTPEVGAYAVEVIPISPATFALKDDELAFIDEDDAENGNRLFERPRQVPNIRKYCIETLFREQMRAKNLARELAENAVAKNRDKKS